MRISCWITKATNTQAEHAIFFYFPTATMVTRTRLNKTNAHWLSCPYKDRNGYWFYVCRFYMNFTTLRITCHSNVIILCAETGITQSLQLLRCILYYRGTRVRFRLSQRLFYTVSRFLLWSTKPPTICYGGLFPWV